MPDWIEKMEQHLGRGASLYDEFAWILEHTDWKGIPKNPADERKIGAWGERLLKRVRELQETRRSKHLTIEDGHGSVWSKRCPVCEKLSMAVMRPGEVECQNPDCPKWH